MSEEDVCLPSARTRAIVLRMRVPNVGVPHDCEGIEMLRNHNAKTAQNLVR